MLSQSSKSKFQLPFWRINLFSNGRSCFTSSFAETDVLKTSTILSFIKSRWFNAQRTQIYIPLPTVVDLIVDKVKDGGDNRAFIHSKKQNVFLKTFCRDLWPQCVDLFCSLVPKLKYFFFTVSVFHVFLQRR